MKKINVDTWIQLLGMLSVVAGLIFVGLEMQQTQRIALANQQQARTELNSNRLLTELELFGEIGAEAITSGLEWSDMTIQQKAIRQQIQRWYWALLENNFFQNEMGLLSDDLWSQVDRYIRGAGIQNATYVIFTTHLLLTSHYAITSVDSPMNVRSRI